MGLWRKREQVILWSTAYFPLLLIMVYRFVDSNDYFKKTKWGLWLGRQVDKTLFDLIVILGIISFSLLIYRLVSNWLFSDYDRQLKDKEIGKDISIRKYERISVNDYSFFLMTLLLPLISIDHASVINFTVTFLIIVIIIIIYVKTDYISVCPVFFISGRHLFKATISDQSRANEAINPLSRQKVIIITRDKSMNLNNKFRTEKLINNIYYVSNTSNNPSTEGN
ncbi:hypothetical protein [Paenibacillus sp. FSL H7-0714]|uniref:hypothetical protein n=1 Tax=Paenibacillus sp. FSL H7-0714 TaxID=2954735 RepID=UPI0030F9B19D